MTAKNPSDTWFYNDWENDEKLKACSLAAQGLWMRLLCIAARSPERGIVQIGDLNLSLPDGLAHVALAVGRPLEEIAPLIDELVSSGAASLDRKKRIFNRRMVKAAALSAKRSEIGKKGAAVTHGKERGSGVSHGKHAGKPLASSSLHPPELRSHGITDGVAASAPAPNGARSQALPSSAKWAERCNAYVETGAWSPLYGPRPDESGRGNVSIPPAIKAETLARLKAKKEAA